MCQKNEPEDPQSSPLDVMKERPATLVLLPLLLIFGFDLVLNIVVLVKRTVEYFAFGKLPSTEVWFSDNIFM